MEARFDYFGYIGIECIRNNQKGFKTKQKIFSLCKKKKKWKVAFQHHVRRSISIPFFLNIVHSTAPNRSNICIRTSVFEIFYLLQVYWTDTGRILEYCPFEWNAFQPIAMLMDEYIYLYLYECQFSSTFGVVLCSLSPFTCYC